MGFYSRTITQPARLASCGISWRAKIRTDRIGGVISNAVRENQLDVVAAMLPWKPPVERGTYWKNYYSSCIGTKEVRELWSWKANPESYQVSEELSAVLSWEKPEYDVKMVLDVLHENKDPFYKKESKPQQNGQFLTMSFGDYLAGGKFQNCKPVVAFVGLWVDTRKPMVE